MSAYLEYTQGVIRVYDHPINTHGPSEGFFAVLNVSKIGPDEALLSADLSNRRLKRQDIVEIRQLLIDAGFKRAYAWRHVGRKVPYGKSGKIIKTVDHLCLWEVEL